MTETMPASRCRKMLPVAPAKECNTATFRGRNWDRRVTQGKAATALLKSSEKRAASVMCPQRRGHAPVMSDCFAR